MKIIRIWVDLLCPECYSVLKRDLTTEQFEKEILFGDEPQVCEHCSQAHEEDGVAWIFPLAIQKREDENHMVEVVHIQGAGIRYSDKPPIQIVSTGASNTTGWRNDSL